jgi:CheY-like chemotaxis protein
MSDSNSLRCLLVEDVAAMRALLRAILEDTGCEIIEAGNLREARQTLRAHDKAKIDYAVLDIDLPDGNGLELIPELGHEVRIIALTAYETRETHLRCLSMGCDAVLSKGGQLAELRKMLIRRGDKSRAARRQIPDHGELYFRYLADTRMELEEARRKVDLLAVRRIAHRLRGTAVHFGHPGIGRFAKSITVALAAGRLSQVEAQTSALSASIAEVLESHQLDHGDKMTGELAPAR